MSNREVLDGTLTTGGLTLPLWVQAFQGWLQICVVVLSIVLLVYTIRCRRLEERHRKAMLEAMGHDMESSDEVE